MCSCPEKQHGLLRGPTTPPAGSVHPEQLPTPFWVNSHLQSPLSLSPMPIMLGCSGEGFCQHVPLGAWCPCGTGLQPGEAGPICWVLRKVSTEGSHSYRVVSAGGLQVLQGQKYTELMTVLGGFTRMARSSCWSQSISSTVRRLLAASSALQGNCSPQLVSDSLSFNISLVNFDFL